MAKKQDSAVLEIHYPDHASYYPVELKELLYVHIGTVSSMSALAGAMSEMGVLKEPIPGFSRLPHHPEITRYNAETTETASALIVKRARNANLNAVIIPPTQPDLTQASANISGLMPNYFTLGILTSVPLNKTPQVFYADGSKNSLNKIIRVVSRDAAPASVLKKEKRKGKRGACFIATACYGSYDCRQVQELRSFRDEVLRKSHAGRILVYWYYRLSPAVADRLSNGPERLRRMVRNCLDAIVVLIRHCSGK